MSDNALTYAEQQATQSVFFFFKLQENEDKISFSWM